MADPHIHDPIDLLELQITCTTLQNECLMRYVTSPEVNLPRIRRILARTFSELKELSVPKEEVRCPTDWVHVMCRCVVPTLKDLSYRPDGKEMTVHEKEMPSMPVVPPSASGSSTPHKEN